MLAEQACMKHPHTPHHHISASGDGDGDGDGDGNREQEQEGAITLAAGGMPVVQLSQLDKRYLSSILALTTFGRQYAIPNWVLGGYSYSDFTQRLCSNQEI